MKFLALCSMCFFCAGLSEIAEAREYQPLQELSWDIGFFAAGIYVEHQTDSNQNNTGRRDLPSQDFDNEARRILHGGQGTHLVSDTEKMAHDLSNLTLGTLFLSPIWNSYQSTNWLQLATFVHSVALNDFVTKVGKAKVRRQRPYQRFDAKAPYKNDAYRSFPSGHSSHAFNAATSLWLIYDDIDPLWRYGGFAFAAATGLFRMAADKHFASDVIVGALIGTGSAFATYYFFESPQQGLSLKIRHNAAELSYGF